MRALNQPLPLGTVCGGVRQVGAEGQVPRGLRATAFQAFYSAAGLRSSEASPTATGSAFVCRPTATPTDLPLSTWCSGVADHGESQEILVVVAKVGTALDWILSWSSLLFEPSRNRILHEGSNGLPGQDRSRTTRSRRGERTHKEWARSPCADLRARTVRSRVPGRVGFRKSGRQEGRPPVVPSEVSRPRRRTRTMADNVSMARAELGRKQRGQAGGPLRSQSVPAAAKGPRHPQGRSELAERSRPRSGLDGDRGPGRLPG